MSVDVKAEVKKIYSSAIKRVSEQASCCSSNSSCCGPNPIDLMYSGEIEDMPDEVKLASFGCGNPVGLAQLKEGDTVLDIGSGAGLDAFYASKKVCPSGRVIGIDMTEEMIEKARENAEKMGVSNVEFRLGDAENMPLDNESVDVIISNCVINLIPDKKKVFEESYRVLREGGKVFISDIMSDKEIPQVARDFMPAYGACISGTIPEDDYLQAIKDAGFNRVEIIQRDRIKFGFDQLRSLAETYGVDDETLRNVASALDGINFFSNKVRAFKEN